MFLFLFLMNPHRGSPIIPRYGTAERFLGSGLEESRTTVWNLLKVESPQGRLRVPTYR